MNSKAEEVITTIVEIFTNRGYEEYLGEPVTISEHMLQAAHFAAEAGADEVSIVAALVHDIGHFTSEHGSFTMEDNKDRIHEHAGARILDGAFPPLEVEAVKNHVDA